MRRLIVAAAYVAVVAALVALVLATTSALLGALGLIGFACASIAFGYAFLRSPRRTSSSWSAPIDGTAEDVADAGPIFVFAVDDVEVFPSVGDASACLEGVDIEGGEYEALFTLDGRIVHAAVSGNDAVLTVTAQRDAADLRARLRAHVDEACLAASADDARAVANEMFRARWQRRWPKRPRWLDERLHGDGPVQV